jgi:hypothetical protein
MDREEVHTRTKDKVLTDVILKSPVDEYEIRFRRTAGFAALALLVLLAIAIAL